MKIKLPTPQRITEDIIFQTSDTPFLEQLEFNIDQLNYRLSILESIDVTVKENQSYFLMVCDSVLVMLRALLLEKGRNNYTIQRYLKSFGLEKQLSVHDNEQFASPVSIKLVPEILISVESGIVLKDAFQEVQECGLACVTLFGHQQENR